MSREDFDDRDNPYRAPRADMAPAAVDLDFSNRPERARLRHIAHEVGLRLMGLAYAVVGLGLAVGLELPRGADWRSAAPHGAVWLLAARLLFGVTAVIGGVALMRLATWSRPVAVVLAAFSLLNFPCGALVGVCLLCLSLSSQARVILSREYREVVRLTPSLHADWTALVIPLALLLAALLLVLHALS